MKPSRSIVMLLYVVAILLLAQVETRADDARHGQRGIVPVDDTVFGLTYGEWGTEWWRWAAGIPIAMNPNFDETGEFGDIDQSGPVWFLAGGTDGEFERTVEIPKGKYIFFPLVTAVSWAPDDLAFAADLVASLGLDPNDFTDLELIRFLSNFELIELKNLRCLIDGKPVRNPRTFYAESPPFEFIDTELFDDLGAPISQPNMAIAAGYWLMLQPLKPGRHRIRFKVDIENEIIGDFHLNVKYTIFVRRGDNRHLRERDPLGTNALPGS